jgi:hypothetical protein
MAERLWEFFAPPAGNRKPVSAAYENNVLLRSGVVAAGSL